MPTPTIFEGINPRGTQTLIPCKDAKAQNGVIANTKLIKDTVGWSGKNKLKNHASTTTTVETTFTVNSDKSVKINTTSATAARRVLMLKTTAQEPKTLPNGRYTIYSLNNNTNVQLVISGYKNGAYVRRIAEANTSSTFDYDNSIYDSFEVGIIIEANKTISNQTIYPMICDANILDTSYEPFNDDTAFPRSEQVVLGAKNLCPNTGTTQTINGITFTVNDDKSITMNGTATDSAVFVINARDKWLKAGVAYKLSGLNGGSSNTYKLDLTTSSGPIIATFEATDFEPVFTVSNSEPYNARIVVYNGQTVSNITVYPMIRLATDPDSNYAPYAMTNEELTDKVQGIINAATNAADFAAFKTAIGNL